jgi:hypothetical protein
MMMYIFCILKILLIFKIIIIYIFIEFIDNKKLEKYNEAGDDV